MGGQLAAIYLAGLGSEAAIARGRRIASAGAAYLSAGRMSWLSWAPTTAVAAAAVVYLIPAWRSSDAYDAANAAGISTQRTAQHQDAPQLAALAAILWHKLPAGSYFQIGDTIGSIAASRADIGSQTLPYLRSACLASTVS